MMKSMIADMFSRRAPHLAILLLTLVLAPLSAQAEMAEPECVFWEGPDIRPTVKGELGDISECPCFMTGIVKNIGDGPAYYTHIVATVWNEKTGELMNTTWAQVAQGALEPGQEEFIRFPLGLSGLEDSDYEQRITLRWKKEQYSQQDVDCEIESTSTRYDDNYSAFLYGMVRNIDDKTGFAPDLKARVLDNQGKTANVVAGKMPRIPLEPGETLPFAVTIPAVSPEDIIDLSLG